MRDLDNTNEGRVLPNKSCNKSRPRVKNPAEEVTAERLSYIKALHATSNRGASIE